MDGETFSDWLMGADAADVDAEVHTQEIFLDSRDEEGRVFMGFPFAYKESVFVDDETGEVYDYSAWSQVVRVEAYDAADGRVRFNDLIGGLGWIAGLAGLWAWFRSRRSGHGS